VRLDPLSPPIQVWAGQALFFSDQQEEGLRILEAQAAATPYLWMPRYFLSLALARTERLEDARAQAEKAVQLSGDNSVTLSHLAILCAATGDHARSGDLLARLQRRAEEGYVPPMLLARAHMARRETEAALRRVREALAGKDPWVSFHRVYDPTVVPPEPRIDALIAASFA
jgi:tetratricopeptide (TPR) repeat protein